MHLEQRLAKMVNTQTPWESADILRNCQYGTHKGCHYKTQL